MEESILNFVNEGGVAIALIIVIGIFIRYISTRDAANTKQSEEFNKTIQNHMNHEEKAFTEMNASHRETATAMREMQDYFRSLNGQLGAKKKRKR